MVAYENKANDNGRATERERSFDPKAHMRQLKGQDYLEARWRVVWFREENPDGQIDTQIIYHDRDKREIMFRATVTVPASAASATGYCEGSERDFKFGYVEKAETQAVGRALAFLGYGTAQAAELDIAEGEKIADAPLEARRATPSSGPTSAGAAPAKAAAKPARAVVRAPGHPPALERLAAEMAASQDQETESGRGQDERTLDGSSPPTRTPSARKTAWECLKVACKAVGLPQPQKLKDVNELAARYGLEPVAELEDVTVEWLDAVRRAVPSRRQTEATPEGGARLPQPQGAIDGERWARSTAGWIASAPASATLEQLAADVLAAQRAGTVTMAAAEALLEAVDARHEELHEEAIARAVEEAVAVSPAAAQVQGKDSAEKEEGQEAIAATPG